ncbi:MAG: helix-turn-helix transcriptional regulator [Acholeplasmataceae bacterium]
MQFNFLYVQRQVKKRQGEKAFIKPPFGSAIKFQRNKMKMTLEEASEGICSVSYLSKLENNLIEASDRFIEPLKKRFNLEIEDIELHKTYEEDFEEMIQTYFWQDKDRLISIDHYYKKPDYQSQLMHIFFYTFLGSDQTVLKHYNNVKSQITSFSNNELALFLICMSLNLFHQSFYEQAYSTLEMVPKEEVHPYLDVLKQYYLIKAAFKMLKFRGVFQSYQTFVDHCIYYHAYHFVKEIKLLQLAFESAYYPLYYIEASINDLSPNFSKQKDWLLVKSLFHHQKYEQVIELSNPYYKDNPEWLILFLIALDKQNKSEEIIQIVSFPFHFTRLQKEVHLITQHLWYKYTKSKDQVLQYLRSKILGAQFLTDYHFLLEYLYFDAQKLFKSSYYYKEAMQLAEQFYIRSKQLTK